MNLSIHVRASVLAVIASGLVGCQTCRTCVDNLPRPHLPQLGLPALQSMMPFRRSASVEQAEPEYYPMPTLPVAVPIESSREPLILPEATTYTAPARSIYRPSSNPPALPPFEEEATIPSAGLFPPTAIRRMGYETSSVDKDTKIIQTGHYGPFGSSCGPQACCPQPSCPTTSCYPPICAPSCEVPCCESPCGRSLGSRLLGAVTHPLYVAKYKAQNFKARLKCKLSLFGSKRCYSSCDPCYVPTCDPCAVSCDPCSPCGNVYGFNGYVTPGMGVNQHPVRGGNWGYRNVPQYPTQYQPGPPMYGQTMVPQQAPCNCQNQQQTMPYQPVPQHQLSGQPFPQQQYQQPAYGSLPAQQPVVQQYPYQYQPQPGQQPQFSNQNMPTPATRSPQTYTAPQTVQPAPPTSAAQQSTFQRTSLNPGYAALVGQAR